MTPLGPALARRAVGLAAVATGGALLLAGTAGAARSQDRPVDAAGAARARLIAPACLTALDPPARVVSVTAVMRPLPQTQKLAVEFQLLERALGGTNAGTWSPVSGAGLGSWSSPSDPATLGQRPGDVWYVRKPVANLDAPALYRFSVSFRWFGAGGRVLATTTLMGGVCRQPELRPDLVVDSVDVTPNLQHPALDDYTAAISNTGVTGAGPVTVQFQAGGSPPVDRQILHIGPHQTVTVRFSGQPACDASQPPTVTVDSNDQIDVSSRTQATLAAQCPASGGSSTTPFARGTPVLN